MPLGNYREVPIKIDGKKMNIGAFARPSEPGVFKTLKDDYEVEAIISLSVIDYSVTVANYSDWIREAGMDPKHYTFGPEVEIYDYYNTPYERTKRIKPSVYDAVYKAVKDAQQKGLKIAMHCGSGDGRTGTALAALKLRELLENAYDKNTNTFDKIGDTFTRVTLKEVWKDVFSSYFVARAVDWVRRKDNEGHRSVETRNDVESLKEYEKHLRKMIQEKHYPQEEEKKMDFEEERKILVAHVNYLIEDFQVVIDAEERGETLPNPDNEPIPTGAECKKMLASIKYLLAAYEGLTLCTEDIERVKGEYKNATNPAYHYLQGTFEFFEYAIKTPNYLGRKSTITAQSPVTNSSHAHMAQALGRATPDAVADEADKADKPDETEEAVKADEADEKKVGKQEEKTGPKFGRH